MFKKCDSWFLASKHGVIFRLVQSGSGRFSKRNYQSRDENPNKKEAISNIHYTSVGIDAFSLRCLLHNTINYACE